MLEREKQVAFAALDQKEQRLSAFSMAAPSGTSCAPPDCSPARVDQYDSRFFIKHKREWIPLTRSR